MIMFSSEPYSDKLYMKMASGKPVASTLSSLNHNGKFNTLTPHHLSLPIQSR